MSRTVLLSEVDQVAGRFPEAVAALHEVATGAGLMRGDETAVRMLAERAMADAGFREELLLGLERARAEAPEMSQLELLGALVVAVAGPERAEALLHSPDLDAPLRTLFNLVLNSRRRQREAESGGRTLWSAARMPVFPDAQVTPPAAPDTSADFERQNAPAEELRRRPLAAAIAPGSSAMLARALALATEEAPAEVQPPEAQVVPTPDVTASSVEPNSGPRWRRPQRETLGSQSVTPLPDMSEVEEPETSSRRWGLWTGIACGVLMGFGLGAFLHLDRRSAPPEGHTAKVNGTEPQADGSSGRRKSINELQAEIAALDSVANATPMTRETTETRQKEPVTRESAHAKRPVRVGPGTRHESIDSSRDHGPVLLARSSAPVPPARVADRPENGASSPAPGAAPLYPVPVVRPAGLSGAGTGNGSVLRTASTAALPRVTTGSAGIMAANLVSSPAPAYPVAASTAGVQGEVVVEAVVGRDGEVVGTRVVSGPLLLRAAALDAVQRWHYRPYEVDGKPIEIATTARLEFRLEP